MAQRDSTLKSQSVATRMYQILSTLDIEFKLTSCVMNFSWLVRNGVSLVYMISYIHFVGIFFPTLASRLNNPPRILIVRLVNERETNDQVNSCDKIHNWLHDQISNLFDTTSIMTKIDLFLSYCVV